MNILIVDDSTTKAGKLAKVLNASGIPRESIEIVSSAMMARERLRQRRYDLLVIDLMLPLREEDEPTFSTAIELLEEVSERDVFFKPNQIVGFTAFGEDAAGANMAFQQYMWTTVPYDPTTAAWEIRFNNVANYLLESAKQSAPRGYELDLCIIAALPEELDALTRIGWAWEEPEPLDDSTFIRRASLTLGVKSVRVVAACCPRMGSVSAALLTSKLVERFRPRFVGMIGICAGVPGKTGIGDVVLFDPTWEWPSGKIQHDSTGSYLQPAPHQLPTSEFIIARAEEIKRDSALWLNIRGRWPGELPTTPLTLHIGPGASGSAVVADNLTLEDIQRQHRKLLALEMEAYGVCAAVRASSSPRPTALILKSVADFADAKKADKWHGYACHTSAHALAEFFTRFYTGMHELAGT